jgi:hypothetical protein
MTNYRAVFWANGLSLLLVVVLIISAKLYGPSVGSLFLQPPSYDSPNVASLTHTFQLLCAFPPVVCAFSFGLLKTIQPKNKQNVFILYSALLTGGFLINEIFRVHILLGRIAGVPKIGVIVVYAIAAIGYGFSFRRTLKSTPYLLLVTGVGLLLLGIIVDSLRLGSEGIPSLLEGIPKLFSEINITLYFWYVCYQEVLRSLKFSPRS